jgi:hypothetical protein
MVESRWSSIGLPDKAAGSLGHQPILAKGAGMKIFIAMIAVAGSLFSALPLSADKQTAKGSQKIEEPKNLVVSINTDNPQGRPISLEFREDLAIARDAWTPRDVQVDGAGNIFIFTDPAWTVRKFNPQGIEIASWTFKKGQGPGEFQTMEAHVLPDGSFHVYDGSQRRLTVLDSRGEVQRIQKTNFWGMLFGMYSKLDMYFLDVRFLAGTRDRQRLVFTKHASSGENLIEMGEYLWGTTFDRAKGKYMTELFRPQMKYTIDARDFVYYAMSDTYEIRVLAPEGRLVQKIVKKGPARLTTQKDTDKKMSFYSESLRAQYDFVIPASVPHIAALFPLDKNYLLAVTFDSPADSNFLLGDVFDTDGIYRGRVQVPLFDNWDGLLQPTSPRAICRGNNFYAIVTDETEEKYFVKRYKIIWK